jgi:hypothetical protein
MRTNILEIINDALAELGDKSEWIRAPEFRPEYEALKRKSVVLVDDVKAIVTNFLPELMVATDGNAHGIIYVDETAEALTEKILSRNPDIILMDYTLSYDEDAFTGDIVITRLREIGFTGKIIGFSSDKDKAKKFAKAGAETSIDKMGGLFDEVVANIASFIKSCE